MAKVFFLFAYITGESIYLPKTNSLGNPYPIENKCKYTLQYQKLGIEFAVSLVN